ncbi:putative lysosomal cystine transporter [Medicago truncatula]|uniref:Putative lysosomal cystine transporter n=1 Tax=Medicago truncatula TaxID=3880 RepID=A0A396HFC5_MEDTR|nr:putative lysosomal cystine transporter [Medicago truncatula]
MQQGTQKLSKYVIAIVAVVWLSAAVCFFIALPTQSWLWLISIFKQVSFSFKSLNIQFIYFNFSSHISIQVCMTLIKYCPQAFMNFLRKSTDGFSIGNVLLDFSGGIFNYSQMVVQSIDQDSLVNFYGNIGKVMISLVTIFYDSILMFQHYILYSHKKVSITSENSEEIQKPLMYSSSSDQQIHDSV